MTQICKKCGVEKPMEAFHKNDTYKSGRASTCIECRHALDKILRQTEEYKAGKLAYARTEKARAAKRRYRISEAGKEVQRRGNQKYNETEKGKAANERKQKKYARTERGKAKSRAMCAKRRALKLGVTVEPVNESAIYEKFDNMCVYCGSREDLGLDHVVALTRGGKHSMDNLVVACRSCNSSKGNSRLDVWLAKRFRQKVKNISNTL